MYNPKNTFIAGITLEGIEHGRNAVRLMEQETPEACFQERERSLIESELYSICWDYGEKRYTSEELHQMTRKALCEALYPLVLAYHKERAEVQLYIDARVKVKAGTFQEEEGTIVEIDFNDPLPYVVKLDRHRGNNPRFHEKELDAREVGKGEKA